MSPGGRETRRAAPRGPGHGAGGGRDRALLEVEGDYRGSPRAVVERSQFM